MSKRRKFRKRFKPEGEVKSLLGALDEVGRKSISEPAEELPRGDFPRSASEWVQSGKPVDRSQKPAEKAVVVDLLGARKDGQQTEAGQDANPESIADSESEPLADSGPKLDPASVSEVAATPEPEPETVLKAESLPMPRREVKTSASAAAREEPELAAELDAEEPLEPKELDYTETVGYRIGIHRIERDMTEAQLAEAVIRRFDLAEINEQKIHLWESDKELVPEEALPALEQVLIDENNDVEDKKSARAGLREAYQRTKEAHINGKKLGGGESFGDKIFELRMGKAGEIGMSEKGLVLQLKGNIPTYPIEERRTEITPELMLRIQIGAYRPSKGLFLAIAKALNEAKELTLRENDNLVSAYESQRQPAFTTIIQNRRPSEFVMDEEVMEMDLTTAQNHLLKKFLIAQLIKYEGSVPNTAEAMRLTDSAIYHRIKVLGIDKEKEVDAKLSKSSQGSSSEASGEQIEEIAPAELQRRMMVLKRKLNSLLFVGDKKITAQAIDDASELHKVQVSFLTGAESKKVPEMSEKKMIEYRDGLIQVLEQKGQEVAKLEEFKITFDDLIAVVMRIKGKAASVGNVDFDGSEDAPEKEEEIPRDELIRRMKVARANIDNILKLDGKRIPNSRLTENSDLIQSQISWLRSPDSEYIPPASEGKLANIRSGLAKAAERLGDGKIDVEALKAMCDNLIAVIMKIKGKTASVGNVDFEKQVANEIVTLDGSPPPANKAEPVEAVIKAKLRNALTIGDIEVTPDEIAEGTTLADDTVAMLFVDDIRVRGITERTAPVYIDKITEYLKDKGQAPDVLESFEDNLLELMALSKRQQVVEKN